MSDLDWSLATFDGVRRAQAARIAEATPVQRLEWLESVLRLALASGTLTKVRQQRQLDAERAWDVRGA